MTRFLLQLKHQLVHSCMLLNYLRSLSFILHIGVKYPQFQQALLSWQRLLRQRLPICNPENRKCVARKRNLDISAHWNDCERRLKLGKKN